MNITLELVNELKGLGEGTIQPVTVRHGICYHLAKKFDILCDELVPYFRRWAAFSGDDSYPVPSQHPTMGSYEFYYEYGYVQRSLWDESSYGNMRRELCLFLADVFERKLNELYKPFLENL